MPPRPASFVAPLPSLEGVLDVMNQVFPGSRIKVIRNSEDTLFTKVTLEVSFACAAVSLIVTQYQSSNHLTGEACLELVNLQSILLFKERLDLSVPSDLVGGLSLVHQAYLNYRSDWEDHLLNADLK